MKRQLLNKIFSKYPTIKNIEDLFDLTEEDLVRILNTENVIEAEKMLKKILEEKNEKKGEVKTLSLNPEYYINF